MGCTIQGLIPDRGKNYLSKTERLALESIQPPNQWVPGFFPQGKVTRAWS